MRRFSGGGPVVPRVADFVEKAVERLIFPLGKGVVEEIPNSFYVDFTLALQCLA